MPSSSLYPPPAVLSAECWSQMPATFRRHGQLPSWGRANRPGEPLPCFIEGPAFDRDGHLWLCDIPYGRLFRVSPQGDWQLAHEYDGWPNGLAIHADGRVFIADYRHGILAFEPATGRLAPVVSERHSEHFRGCNDLTFDRQGRLYFTDQGQSGLHMPNGRVYRFDPGERRLDLLIDTGPSPNGLVLNQDAGALLVAMTRANAVWRLPLMADDTVSKVGLFVQLSGGLGGPDGLALADDGGLLVAHVGNGCVWGFDRLGRPRWRIDCGDDLSITNLAFSPDGPGWLYITESAGGAIWRVKLPIGGQPLYSHA